MAAFAGAHGETVAKNIVQDLMGGAASPYKRVNELLNFFCLYDRKSACTFQLQPFVGMLVPFGKSAGAGMFNGFHIPSFVGSRLKYAGLFTDKYWTMAGLKMPQ